MRHVLFVIVLLAVSFGHPYLAKAQTDTSHNAQGETGSIDSTCVQKDIGDVIRVALHKQPKPDSSNAGSVLLIPIIGSNPATGFMVGIGGQYAFKLKGIDTKYSLISGSAQITTKSQIIFMLKNTIYAKGNNVFFSGDWRYLIFSQSTYGLGTNAPQGGILDYQYGLGGETTSVDTLAQPLEFNFARFYQSVSVRVLRKYTGFYVGAGYNLDSYSKIKDLKLNLNPGDSLITSHYAYSKQYGFDTSHYVESTLSFNLVSDTRDNIINPYRGHFALVTWRSSLKIFSDKNSASFLYTEWRSFHPFSQRNPRHLLAFWYMGEFSPSGSLPYLIMPATAYDQRGRSGRGYTQGRFRGNNLMYGEAEYRFPISRCGGVLGGVLFVNATTASNPDAELGLFESIKPGYGAGLRVMVDKKTRTNLSIDLGWGDKSFGFYLAASETF